MNCQVCNTKIMRLYAHRPNKYCSRECYYLFLKQNGDKVSGYKGEAVGYAGIHAWVRRRLGRPSECRHCGVEGDRMYHWANVSGQYKRDTNDWVRLCVPCHHKFDNIHQKMWITRKSI